MNTLKTTLLLAGLTGLLLFLGDLIGGQTGMVIALIIAAAMNFTSYWYSDRLVLKMYNAQPVGPGDAPVLYQVVQDLAARAGLPMPKVYVIHEEAPNAFATGRNPEHAAVAATTGLLRILTREELAGVMAHELSHVEHRDILTSTVAATVAGAIAMLANMAQWMFLFGGGRGDEEEGGGAFGLIGGLLMMILAPIAASLIQMAISRSREFAADARGAEIAGNPLWLARALHKLEVYNQRTYMPEAEAHPSTAQMMIVNPLKGRSWDQLFSTHPPTAERIARLEALARRGMRRAV